MSHSKCYAQVMHRGSFAGICRSSARVIRVCLLTEYVSSFFGYRTIDPQIALLACSDCVGAAVQMPMTGQDKAKLITMTWMV